MGYKKKKIYKLFVAAGCSLALSQCLIQESFAYTLVPINFLLLRDRCTGMKLRPGFSAGQQSATGGRTYFYDIYTMIDDAPSVYLTSVPSAGLRGNDSGYLFGFFPENSVKYQFQAQASDSKGLKGYASDWSVVDTTYYDQKKQKSASFPVADPGLPQVVQTGTEVTLDGSGSYDPATGDNPRLLYRWECYSSTASITLADSNTVNPKFTPAEKGTYQFRLIVSKEKTGGAGEEEGSQSAIRYTQVQAVDNLADALNASAGVPLQVPLNGKIVLDGSMSLPVPANNGLYKWELINRESLGTTAVIIDSSLPVASLVPDRTGAHFFRLTVMNNEAYSYQFVTVSVYDASKVGALVEQDIAKGCDLDCRIADLNEDGQIDNLDFVLMVAANGSGRGETAYLKKADFDRNLQVNSHDLEVVEKCMGKSVK
jgi:hypothetical protein